MLPRDLLSDIPKHLTEEHFETLLTRAGITLQRIISPPGFQSRPFLQSEDEWVMLLQGRATLDLDGAQVDLHLPEAGC